MQTTNPSASTTRTYSRAFLLGLLLSLMTIGVHADVSNEEDTPLHKAAQQWIDAFTTGDLDALMALYQPDVTVALHGQPVLNGIDQVRAYFADRIGLWNSQFELKFERVEMGKTRSWLISQYWFIAEDKNTGDRFRDAGRSLLVYEKSADGRWLIVADIDQATPDVGWPSPQGRE